MKNQIIFITLFFCLSIFSGELACQNFYKTPSGEKFHVYECRMVESVSEKVTIEEAYSKNLTPCKICKPQVNRTFSTRSPNKAKGKKATQQCQGRTRKATRCRHMTSIGGGFCYQHTSQSLLIQPKSNLYLNENSTVSRCGALTKSGKPCKRRTKEGGRCFQH